MEDKYLPIGTVCTVKNKNKKVMIISYFPIEYNGNVKMYDYSGCVYPEGLLLPSQAISFNHNDIENIDFIGYKNEQYDVFNNSLNSNEEKENQEYEQKPYMTNFKFDENGVVVFDGTNNKETENKPVSENLTISNPFKQEFKEVDQQKKSTQKSIFKFDENGVVISQEPAPVAETQPKYVFDENGFVISQNFDVENNEQEEITTDETVVSSKYKFDENGIVIGVSDTEIDNNQAITDSNNNTASSKYKFDENGIVISVSDTEENNNLI